MLRCVFILVAPLSAFTEFLPGTTLYYTAEPFNGIALTMTNLAILTTNFGKY